MSVDKPYHPPPTLAQYCHQGFIYPRRVFHISSPVTGMAESIPQSAALGNTPSNLFCQSISYAPHPSDGERRLMLARFVAPVTRPGVVRQPRAAAWTPR